MKCFGVLSLFEFCFLRFCFVLLIELVWFGYGNNKQQQTKRSVELIAA